MNLTVRRLGGAGMAIELRGRLILNLSGAIPVVELGLKHHNHSNKQASDSRNGVVFLGNGSQ